MKPIRVPDFIPEQLAELEELYRSTRNVRLRTRAQMVLLAAERCLTAAEMIAEIVRASEETVRRWLKRYLAEEGVEGLSDAPQPGAPRKVTEEYREELLHAVGRRPRREPPGGLPFSLWTLQRLESRLHGRNHGHPSDLRERTGTLEKATEIVLSRPQQHTITSPDPPEYALKKRRSKRPATTSQKGMPSTMPTSST